MLETALGRVEIREAGTGPLLIAMHGHGYGSGPHNYAWLADELPGHRVVTLARPGYGRTPVATAPTFPEQGRLAIAIADALEVDKCVVLGASNGGPAALWAATEFPDRVAGAVFWCSVATPLIPPDAPREIPSEEEMNSDHENFISTYRAAVDLLSQPEVRFEGPILAIAKSVLSDDEIDSVQSDPAFIARMRDYQNGRILGAPGFDGMRNDEVENLADGTRRRKLLTVPALVQHGDADKNVPIEHGRFLADLSNSVEMHVVKGGSHAFFLTFRNETVDRLRDFLSRIS
ncbi:MAG: alpha/beta hydrolase [Actinobacteria bacterium]|nr:alpha/beta hydrolase [Actinomycetota bacterium]